MRTQKLKTKFAERLSFFLKENYNEKGFIDVQPVSPAYFKISVMPAALQLALITSQPFPDCRNLYTFLIALACSDFKVEIRRSTSIVVTSRFGSRSISFVIAFVMYSLKHFFSIFFTDGFVVKSRS